MKNRMKKIIISIIMLFSGLLFGIMEGKEIIQAYEVSGFYQYETIDDNSVRIIKYTGGEITVNIPSKLDGKNVIEIGDNAFKEGLMTYVDIPDTIVSIGFGAFYNCDSLEEITIPDSVKEIRSSRYYETFGDCGNLKKVVIGKSVKNIGESTFRNCEQLESINIPRTVSEIGDNTFYNCISLKNLTLNEGLEYIGFEAFYNCDSLEKITIPDSVKEIRSSRYSKTFGDCGNLEKVIIGNGIKKIGGGCFRDCIKLKTVIIDDKAEFNIEEGTFRNCEQLESINIPRTVSEIGDNTFYNCISLKNLTLNEGLEYIGFEVFYNCDSLEEIIIPDSVKEISSSRYSKTFGDCGNLKIITIGKNTDKIGDYCFGGCKNLEKVVIPKNVTEIGNDILEDSEKAVIYGFSGTVAQTYANENEIHFVEMLDVPMTSISFDDPEVYMMTGENLIPTIQISPIDTTDGIQWQSSDENIAIVNNSGKVTAKQEGSVTIIATSTNGIRESYNVVVSKAPEYLTFNLIEKEAKIGDTFRNVAIVDEGRTDILVVYKSSDDNIAFVDEEGTVEVLSEGECDIIAETSGGLTASYKLIVKTKGETEFNSSTNSKKRLKLKNTKAVIKKGKTIRIKAVARPSVKIRYSSSNKKIAIVNSNGVVKARKKGKTVILVKANGITKKFKVTVK